MRGGGEEEKRGEEAKRGKERRRIGEEGSTVRHCCCCCCCSQASFVLSSPLSGRWRTQEQTGVHETPPPGYQGCQPRLHTAAAPALSALLSCCCWGDGRSASTSSRVALGCRDQHHTHTHCSEVWSDGLYPFNVTQRHLPLAALRLEGERGLDSREEKKGRVRGRARQSAPDHARTHGTPRDSGLVHALEQRIKSKCCSNDSAAFLKAQHVRFSSI